jgi:Cd(II)/Pb(II)-responsive transcriptional regulator
MKIGDLARMAGTQVETIRYYEREGLLPKPSRSEGNYRIYGEMHADRLAFIRQCRGLDMSLDEVRILLGFSDAPMENCNEVNVLLDEHISHVVARIRELKGLERRLRALREQCTSNQLVMNCGILGGLEKAARVQSRKSSVPSPSVHVLGPHSQPLKRT